MVLESIFNNPYLLTAMILFVLAIIVVVLLVNKVSKNNYLKNIPNSFGLDIYAYLDKKGEIINFTPKFLEKLNISNIKEWTEEVSSITVDNKQLTFKEFINYLKTDNLTTVDFDCDGVKISMSLEKKAIEDEDKIYGYVVFENSKQTKDSMIDSIYETVKDVCAPMAIYSGDPNNIKLMVNEALRVKLGLQSTYLKYSELKNFIFENLDCIMNNNDRK